MHRNSRCSPTHSPVRTDAAGVSCRRGHLRRSGGRGTTARRRAGGASRCGRGRARHPPRRRRRRGGGRSRPRPAARRDRGPKARSAGARGVRDRGDRRGRGGGERRRRAPGRRDAGGSSRAWKTSSAPNSRRRMQLFADSPPPIAGRTVIVVDDGIATGATATAACRSLKAQGAGRIVLAVPVAPAAWQPARGRGRRVRVPASDPRLLGGRAVLHRLHADDRPRGHAPPRGRFERLSVRGAPRTLSLPS